MFNGTVTFRVRIKGNGLKFPSCEYDPHEPGVPKVEIEGPDGREIRGTIHLASVPTEEAGISIANRVSTTALDRLSFLHNIVIENAQIIGSQFEPLNPPSGVCITPSPAKLVITSYPPSVTIGTTAATIKVQLEQSLSTRESLFSLFRSARLSEGAVEEFMHLYNLLRMIVGDSEKAVEDFVMREAPTTLRRPSPSPHVKSGDEETVYTRLRNELAHPSRGVNIDQTKVEMAHWVGELAVLTKRAIELHLKSSEKEERP